MLKTLTACLLLLSSPLAASVESEALAALNAAGIQAAAASAIHSPSLNNIDKVRGDIGVLPPFFRRLADALAKVEIGPSARVREISLGLSLKLEDAGKTTSLNVSALLEACKGIGADLDAFNALLPQLRQALQSRVDQDTASAVRQQVALVLPTPIPGLASAPVVLPTQVPLPASAIPAPAAAPADHGPSSAPPPPANLGGLEGGLLPGGIILPAPQAPAQPAPSAPGQPTPQPTPRAQLKAPLALACLANGAEVFVANFNEGTVAVLEAGLRRISTRIVVGVQPSALALDQSGHRLLCANRGSDSASLIDTRDRKVLATLKTGAQPVDLCLTPDGKKAYVVNQGDGTVTVLDLDRRKPVRSLSVGRQPSRIALPANGHLAYVSNTQDDSLSVIDTRIDEVVAVVGE